MCDMYSTCCNAPENPWLTHFLLQMEENKKFVWHSSQQMSHRLSENVTCSLPLIINHRNRNLLPPPRLYLQKEIEEKEEKLKTLLEKFGELKEHSGGQEIPAKLQVNKTAPFLRQQHLASL